MKNFNKPKEHASYYPSAFQAAVALAAIEGKEPLQDIAMRYGVDVEVVREWKDALMIGATRAFYQDSPHSENASSISTNELALTIAENSTQGFAMMDEHGYCIYANRAWLQMTGYTAGELRSTVLHDLVHHHYPDGRPFPMAECPIDRALPENFEVRAHEDLFFRKDGSSFSVLCAASPIFRNGRPVATVIEIRDITESKRTDETLRRNSKRQEFQLQLAECLRTLTQPHHIIEAASRLIGQYFHVGRVGYGEVNDIETTVSVHRDWTDGTVKSLAGEARPLESFGPVIINALRRGETLRLDDIASDERSTAYTEGYASIGARSMIVVPMLEGQQLTAILYLHEAIPRQWTEDEIEIAEDVARRTWEAVKRAHAEEKLRDESRVLELLNQTGQLASSTLDMQTLLQSITDTATQLSHAQFGAFFYTMTNELGDAYMLYTLCGAPREAFEKFGHPRATPLFGPTFGGQTIRSDDILQDERYGKWGPHHGMPTSHLPVRSYLAVPVKTRSGQAIGGLFFGHSQVGVFTERTERLILGVAAQAGIAVDNARLYEQAQKSALEREQLLKSERAARTEAERLSKMKDEFLAMLAHELRNPLAPITTAAEMLKFAGLDPDRIRKTSDIITRQVCHMTDLVDDLLDMSRVTRGLVTLQEEPLDIKAIAADAIEQVRPLIESKQQHLITDVDEQTPFVFADRTRLTQILANILNNAAKYTPKQGEIKLRLHAQPNEVEITVEDNGIGISPELLPHVFDLFTQGERSPDRAQGGLGLGLTLVRSLTALQRGRVSAYSEGLGQGSRFTLVFPRLLNTATDNTKNKVSGIETQRNIQHMLVVDDNADAALTLSMMLETLGHQVFIENNAHAAIETAKRHAPKFLFLDIGLPEMDGYELARRLRAVPELAESTLIAVTGYGQQEDKERSTKAGFDHHLVKPVRLESLLDLVNPT